jgi:Tfp pilus assembly protein FimT
VPAQRPLHRRLGGFTLNELLLTIVILTVLVGLAWPRLDWTRYRLNAQVRAVQLLLSSAGRLAVTEQRDVRVTIDHKDRRAIVHVDLNNDGIFEAIERRRGVQLDDGVNFERMGAPDLPGPGAANELDAILFRRDGSVDRPGVVFLNTERARNRRSIHDVRALQIIRATGRAVAYRFTASGWQRGS